MNPNQDYKQLLTEVIKKQIVILGPDITLSKARNVKGLVVANDGTVTAYTGEPQAVTQALIDQFVQLSGLIVKQTMEPLLSMPQPTLQNPSVIASETKQSNTNNEIAASQAPRNDVSTPAQPITSVATPPTTTPTPAKNPLAA